MLNKSTSGNILTIQVAIVASMKRDEAETAHI